MKPSQRLVNSMTCPVSDEHAIIGWSSFFSAEEWLSLMRTSSDARLVARIG